MTKNTTEEFYSKLREILLYERKKLNDQLQELISCPIGEPTDEQVSNFRCRLSRIALINKLLIDFAEIFNETT